MFSFLTSMAGAFYIITHSGHTPLNPGCTAILCAYLPTHKAVHRMVSSDSLG